MKHKWHDMIVAKAANMESVVFVRVRPSETDFEWLETTFSDLCANPNKTFFACLPQHNENGQCLHWLNGGDVLLKDFEEDASERIVDSSAFSGWHENTVFMSKEAQIRIKPKKQKRWIGVSPSSCHSTGHYETKQEAVDITKNQPWASAYSPWQFIEVEVEV